MEWGSATFGEELRARRVRAGLTQAELAARAGVSVRAVRYIEQGRIARPRRESVKRLAEVVGLDADGPWTAGDRGADLLRLGVLGRLELHRGAQPVETGPLKQRSLLALLALQPNRVVQHDEIVDMLWGARPPDSVQNLVHTYVSRLRKVTGGQPGPISSARGGYRLTLGPEQLDLLRFDELIARAGEARQADPEQALALYEQALRLWRGPALVDLPDRIRHHPAATALGGRRIAAALAHADTALGLGRHEDVAAQLRELVHEEPLHEGLHARLMLGLAGSGQQAAALRLFADIRGRLAEDLGIEPGSEMVAAHLRIIRNEVVTAGGPVPAALSHPVPAQLPADIGGFTGREYHLGRLNAVLRKRNSANNTAVVIAALTGTAGVGKTALALHWAHRVREEFPDGQLYVNLRGYASDSPVRPLEALTRFLHALGLPAERVPADEEEAVGLYRTVLADRRALVLLDNAASADQVRPLLPGSPGCLVLVTSRDRLAGLTATEGAHRLTLDVLDPEEANALLRRMIPDERADEDPNAVTDLAEACAYLPLALRIVAANLASLQHTSIGDYTDELRKRGRLTELVVEGDDEGAVRAAFDLSYDSLQPEARRLFRRLGLVPGVDFTADVAGALLDLEPAEARRWMGQLAVANLVGEHAAGRYQFHDLLREYAADRARTEDGAEAMQAATDRLLASYLRATDAATRLLYPHAPRIPAVRDQSPEPAVARAGEAAAIDWLDTELPNLVAAVRACPPDLMHYTWRLVDSLRGYFVARGHCAEGLAITRIAVTAAQQDGDPHAEASVNDVLGLIHYNVSDYAKATSCHSRALALHRRTGNELGEAGSLHNLGRVHSQLGKPTQASLYHEQALTINRRLGNRYGEASDLNYVGAAWLSRGRPDRAIAYQTQALAISREIGGRTLEMVACNGLGLAHWALGELDRAVKFHVDCLAVCGQLGHKLGETNGLVCLAETNCDAGRYQEAYAQAQTGITNGRQLGERRHEVGGLDVLATVHLRRNRPEIARGYYADALQIAREIGFGYGETSVLIGLSAALRETGQLADAVAYGHDALAVLNDSGMRLLEGRALTELAHGYLALGNLEQATMHAQRALRAVRTRRQRLAEARALHVLGLVRQASRDPEGAASSWRAALEIFTGIGTPEAEDVRALLTSPASA
jgi:DNA-binding SARP family transcriptional activator/DNA-binding XRE family transcriptional regulator